MAGAAACAPLALLSPRGRMGTRRCFTCGCANTGRRLEVACGSSCAATTLAMVGGLGKPGWIALMVILAAGVAIVLISRGGDDGSAGQSQRPPGATTQTSAPPAPPGKATPQPHRQRVHRGHGRRPD